MLLTLGYNRQHSFVTSKLWPRLLFRLEPFSFRCIEALAGVADRVGTLGGGAGSEGRPHRGRQGGHGARRDGPQAGFEFGKDLLNGIEVRTVGGQVEQARPSGLERPAPAGHFMAGQIVQDHAVARVEGGASPCAT